MKRPHGAATDRRRCAQNQDCHWVFEFPDWTLAIVCDGMGPSGVLASTLAVQTLHDAVRDLQGRPVGQVLKEAIEVVNGVLHGVGQKNPRLSGTGTTVVAAAIGANSCIVAHVGDSRAYLVRRDQVSPLTRDHTLVNLFVDAELLSAEDALDHPERHVLARSVGADDVVEVEISDPIPLELGDVVFLCSDGVHRIVTDKEIANAGWEAPREATRQILRRVAVRGGEDNATAVGVRLGSSPEQFAVTPVPEPNRGPLVDHLAGGLACGRSLAIETSAVPQLEGMPLDQQVPGHRLGLLPREFVTGSASTGPEVVLHLALAHEKPREIGRMRCNQGVFTIGNHLGDDFYHPTMPSAAWLRIERTAQGEIEVALDPAHLIARRRGFVSFGGACAGRLFMSQRNR